MSKIFLLYSGRNKIRVRRLAMALEKIGIDTWYAHRDLQRSDDAEMVISNIISKCTVFIFCVSRATDDLAGFFAKEKLLVENRIREDPSVSYYNVKIQGQAKGGFKNSQTFDLSGLDRWDRGVPELAEALGYPQ